MENSQINIKQFIEKKLRTIKVPLFFKNKITRIFAYRFLGIFLLIKREISMIDALRNFLPSRFKNEETDKKIFNAIKREFNIILKSNHIYDSNSVELFGKKLFPANEQTQLESWLHTCIMIFQSIITDQYHAKEFIRPDSIIIDAGANMGIFSLYSLFLAKKGKVYSFEPTPKTYEILVKNTQNDNRISTFCYGLGDKKKEGELILAESSGSNTLSDSGIKQFPLLGSVRIPIITLDDFVKEHDVQKIDFIKMDTEGYEMQIIEGARETIKRFSPVLSLSAYHHKEDREKIPAMIKSIDSRYNYKISEDVEDNLLFWI